ncbi:MAG: hypothetical protein K2M94_06860 [Paramuribaculum sp.]|nr:hypothetical protein [Paramuribaculum sp.]
MRNFIFAIITFLAVGINFSGCSLSEDKLKSVPVKLLRFDEVAYGYASQDDSVKMKLSAQYAPVVSLLSKVYGIDSASFISEYGDSRAVQVFEPDVKARFVVADSVSDAMGKVSARFAGMFGENGFPAAVYGAIIPFNQSIIVSDTIIAIGLNHYLGADYEGYEAFEAYRRRMKTPSRMVPDVVEAFVSVRFPYISDMESTVLSRLIYEGVVVKCMMQLAAVDSAVALGFTPEEYEWAQANEARIWQALIANRLLYSTNPNDAVRLVDPSPVANIINANAPGRVGRYTGLKIVESYLENNPEAKLENMLTPDFYNDPTVLIKSKYTPR